MALGNLAGKFVAIGREIVFAGAFGAGDVASGFRVAQSASMVPANLISGDLLSAAFAPTYSRQVQDDIGAARATLTAYTVWLSLLLSLVASAVYFAREPIVRAMVPGLEDSSMGLAMDFLGVLSWAIPLYGISAVHSLALAAQGRYLSTSLRPIIQSLGLLSGTIAAVTLGWLPWLAYGFIIAWCIYAIVCFILLLRAASFGRIRWNQLLASWALFVAGLITVVPLLPLPIFMQLSIILERLFSSLGDQGLVAAVDYARTISDSVMSVVAVPLGVLGLTSLAGLPSRSYRRKVSGLSELVLIFVLPTAGLLFLLADPIVRLLFQRGAFDDAARHLTVSVLVGHSLGLTFQVLGYALSRALTADGRNRVVLMVTILGLAVQIVVQGLGIVVIGPIAIGLGPSAFGLVLTVGFALALGLLGRILYCLSCLAPTILLTVILSLWNGNFLAVAGVLMVGFLLNVWIAPPLRHRVHRHLKPLLSKWR